MEPIPRVDVLGVGLSAITMDTAIETIGRWIEQRRPHYVCVTGVHGVMESQRDPQLREIHNRSGLTTPDGMPMVWASHWAGARHVRRVYGPDLMIAASSEATNRGWKFFLYGGKVGVPELLADSLVDRFPDLQIVGSYSPPFRPLTSTEDDQVVEMINSSGADIVWVGLSTPKQERWMAEHIGRVEAPVLIGVGAAFDIHAGLASQAPRWMQRSGMEWFYRLLREPRRLWRRYLLNNPRFLINILRRRPRLMSAAEYPANPEQR